MNVGLDTSVLVRVVSGLPREQAEAVAFRLAQIMDDGGVCEVSDIAVVEAYYALQQFYGMTKKQVLGHFRTLSLTPGFRFSPEASAALETPNVERASPGFVDRILAAGYRAKGATTLSCEKSFRKLPLAEVVG